MFGGIVSCDNEQQKQKQQGAQREQQWDEWTSAFALSMLCGSYSHCNLRFELSSLSRYRVPQLVVAP